MRAERAGVFGDLGGDLVEAVGPRPGRGELDGERHAVDRAADAGHAFEGGVVGVVRRAQPFEEQLAGGCRAGVGALGGQEQRFERHHELAVDVQRHPARGQHGQLRAVDEQVVDELGDRIEDVLAVVEQQQHPAVAAERAQGVAR